MQQLLQEKDELRKIVSCHNMLVKNLCIKLHSLALSMMALKIIVIYVQGYEKRKPKQLYTDFCEIKFEKMIVVNLDRQVIYRIAVQYRAEDPF